MAKCGCLSFSSIDGVDQWWECDRDDGAHSGLFTVVDADGNEILMKRKIDHHFVAVPGIPEKALPPE